MQINAAGGIMGHPLNCANYDTKGDPADAVPVTNRMLVSASHLVMVVGPDGSDIPSVLPVLEQAKVPELNTVGDPRYDSQTSPDFWRLTPSDSTQAPALAFYTHQQGYTKIAEVFTNDLSAQTTTTPFQSTFSKLGGTILKAETITPDTSSYETEVAAILATHPQAIVGEMDAQTAATFLSEVRQQNGSLIPVIMTQRAIQGDWEPAVGPGRHGERGDVRQGDRPGAPGDRHGVQRLRERPDERQGEPVPGEEPLRRRHLRRDRRARPRDGRVEVRRPAHVHRLHPQGHRRGKRRHGGFHLRAGGRRAQGGQDHPVRRRGRPDGLQPVRHGEPAVRPVDLQRHRAQLDHGHDTARQRGALTGAIVSQIVLSLGFGLVTASILALGAVGFTLQFGVTNLFNLAFGETMTVAAFVAYLAMVSLHWNLWWAMAAGGAAGMVLSLLISRLVYLPFLRRGTSQFAMVMVTVAVSFILKNVLQIFSGATYLQLPAPTRAVAALPRHGVRRAAAHDHRPVRRQPARPAPPVQVHATWQGHAGDLRQRRTRPVRRDTDEPDRQRRLALSGLFAGLAGVALAIDLGTFNSTTGGSYLLLIVAAAVFGSVGEPYGAVVGAVVIGLASEVAANYDPQLKDVVAFGMLGPCAAAAPRWAAGWPGATTRGGHSMSDAIQSYIATLLVYLGVNSIACWGLNLQFGVGGVMNFAFILYQAMGAYITAVLTLPSAATQADERYILGWHLPWPLPIVGAAVVGAALALVVGSFALRPRRRDFQATVMLVVSIIAATLVTADRAGSTGTRACSASRSPSPRRSTSAVTAVLLVLRRAHPRSRGPRAVLQRAAASSPWARRLRAMRDNAEAAESLGVNVRAESLKVYVIGGAIAALSGGLLVEFIGAWSPSAWGTGETFIFFVAVIVGGLGNTFGAFFGAFLVLGVFLELRPTCRSSPTPTPRSRSRRRSSAC